MKPDYQKALDIQDANKIVYAYFHADTKSFYMPCDDQYCYLGPVWIVWFPESVEYTNMEPEKFDERYVLEANCPPALRAKLDFFPSYEEWIEQVNGEVLEQ